MVSISTTGAMPSPGESDEAVTGISDGRETLADECNKMCDRYNEGPGFWGGIGNFFGDVFGDGFMEKVLEALNTIKEAVEAVIAELGKLLSPGNPWRFATLADDWRAVVTLLTGQSAQMADTNFQARESWTGREGCKYGGMPGMQNGAIQGLAPKASLMADVSDARARANVFGWLAVAKQLADTLIDYVDGGLQFVTADPTDWLSIVPMISNLVATLLKDIGDLIALILELLENTLSQIADLKTGMSDISGMMGATTIGGMPTWPTSDLSMS